MKKLLWVFIFFLIFSNQTIAQSSGDLLYVKVIEKFDKYDNYTKLRPAQFEYIYVEMPYIVINEDIYRVYKSEKAKDCTLFWLSSINDNIEALFGLCDDSSGYISNKRTGEGVLFLILDIIRE